MSRARVLSIQSHVVSGYVGNKSAVFPMQVLGIDVDFINSVQFSNHTGYKVIKGQILTETDLSDLMEGLSANRIDTYSHLLTGYVGSVSFLNQIIAVLEQLKKKNPNLIYVCDPVMGDNGKLYVPKELVPIYKESVLKHANILTPNLFEAEVLTDMTIKDVKDVWKAIEILHNKGCKTVVISSADLPGEHNVLNVFASRIKDNTNEKYMMEIKKMPVPFTGSGDLFAALILSWMYKTKEDLKKSLEYTISSIQAVLQRTMDSAQGQEDSPSARELKLVQSKCDIEEPKVIYKAIPVE